MFVVFISACEKKALKRTRAILDSYACRIGDGTWTTPVTQEGLLEIHAQLRQQATRQTAVACYRGDGHNKLTLLWTVGSNKFGSLGQIAVGSQHRPGPMPPAWALRAHRLACLAGLLHDLGKYAEFFQHKLLVPGKIQDYVRHEWLSLLLLHQIQQGASWPDAWAALGRMPATDLKDDALVFNKALDSAYAAVGYLVASHHRLPDEHGPGALAPATYLNLTDPRPIQAVASLPAPLEQRIRNALARLDALADITSALYWRGLATVSRIALILADHTVSNENQAGKPGHKNAAAYANSVEGAHRAGRKLNQSLPWHLERVSETAGDYALKLAGLRLPALSPFTLAAIDTPASGRFAWQEVASQAIRSDVSAHGRRPRLIFNMAGTGAGKTRMNARALVSAVGDEPVRIAALLNLRTLTLQTRDAYVDQVGVAAQELACIIGDQTTRRMHEAARADAAGRASLIPEKEAPEPEYQASGEGALPDWLDGYVEQRRKPAMRPILGAPFLVSTIDFLASAMDLTRQGNHVLAMTRVMTSDLILDEIDSYDTGGLATVAGLVLYAAFWGRNVVVSSATMARPIASALWRAFNKGLEMRKEVFQEPQSGRYAIISDGTEPALFAADSLDIFEHRFNSAVNDLMRSLSKDRSRVPELLDVSEALAASSPAKAIEHWHAAIAKAARRYHADHAVQDPDTGKRVSFGVIRIANIKGAIALSKYLAKAMPEARIACYHAQLFAAHRYHIEKTLDRVLTRKGATPDAHIFKDALVAPHLAGAPEDGVPFIVVATPVEEVGRDHDFDWAIIEPSSVYSIVQLCGRVRRHRLGEVGSPNVGILRYNRKAILKRLKKRAVFARPGWEPEDNPYKSHDMAELLDWSKLSSIDAGLRFGSHPFAQLDDASIAAEIGRVLPRILSEDMLGNLWMSATTYTEKCRLRDADNSTENWTYNPQTGKHLRLERNPAGKQVYVSRALGGAEQSAPANAWLALTPQEIEEIADQTGLTREQAFAYKVRVYGPEGDSSIDCHWAYGIQATPVSDKFR